MRVLLVFFLGFACSAARADFQVVDDRGVLGELSQWGYRGPEFGAAMSCQSSALYDAPTSSCQLKCTNSYCTSKCEESADPKKARLTLQIDECSSEQVSVFADNGFTATVTKADYAADGNIWARAFLRAIGPFVAPDGVVQVQSSFPFTIQLVIDGHLKSLKAFSIRGNVAYPNISQTEGFRLVVSGDLPGASQIVSFSLGGDTLFLRLHGAIIPDGP